MSTPSPSFPKAPQEKNLDYIVESVLNFHAEDGNFLLLKCLVVGFFDDEFRPFIQSFIEATSNPIEPVSICPKCRSHVGVWTAYVGFNEYKCQTCGNEWEEVSD